MVKTRSRGKSKRKSAKKPKTSEHLEDQRIYSDLPPVELLIRKMVGSNIGVPSKAKLESLPAYKSKMIMISRKFAKGGDLFLRTSPYDKKRVFPFAVKFEYPESAKKQMKKKNGLHAVLEQFAQKKTQKKYFKVAQNIAMQLAKYYGWENIYMGTEISLGIMSRNGEYVETGSRDLFLYGNEPNSNIKQGVSVEVSSHLDSRMLKKLLYSLHDTLHVSTENGVEPVRLKHSIILTDHITDHLIRTFKLDKFNGEPLLNGKFDVGEEIERMRTDPDRIRELMGAIKDLGYSDLIMFEDTFGHKDYNKLLFRLGNIKKRVELGNKPTVKDVRYMADVLSRLKHINYEKNAIDFTITPEVVSHLKNDNEFISSLSSYITGRSFPTDLRTRVMKEIKKNGKLSDATLMDALNYLAGHARKTLQRTTIVLLPSKGYNMHSSPDLDKMKIISFSRLDGEFKLIPKTITMENYNDIAWKEELAEHAKRIDKSIDDGELNLTYKRYMPADTIGFMKGIPAKIVDKLQAKKKSSK